MAVKVLLAFSNNIFSEGIARLLSDDSEITVDLFNRADSAAKSLKAFDADIILIDFVTLYNTFTDIKPTKKRSYLLVDTCCGDEIIVSAFLKAKVSGILMIDTDSTLLRRAIHSVYNGEVWVDNKTIKNLLSGLGSITDAGQSNNLSPREKEIVALVASGYRNKEIGLKLCISEPTVKTHLYRVFQKLNISNRPQLVVYAMKNQILEANA
ncbi:MAG: response regulator transcription factor [Proteobacteria bacterium]|nr:response regulator transcription factor [Pseudomonadota bacterium]